MLWRWFREHRPEKCCCGLGFVDIDLGNVTVAKVLGVSKNRKRFELTIVMRNRFTEAYKIPTRPGAGTLERVGRGNAHQFQYQLFVDR